MWGEIDFIFWNSKYPSFESSFDTSDGLLMFSFQIQKSPKETKPCCNGGFDKLLQIIGIDLNYHLNQIQIEPVIPSTLVPFMNQNSSDLQAYRFDF